jgi:hypothetical protein
VYLDCLRKRPLLVSWHKTDCTMTELSCTNVGTSLSCDDRSHLRFVSEEHLHSRFDLFCGSDDGCAVYSEFLSGLCDMWKDEDDTLVLIYSSISDDHR